MRLTVRDAQLVRDLALSHVMSRDQLIDLDYFGSVTRANTRLRELRSIGLVRVVETPFFAQTLYAVGPEAAPILGERMDWLVSGRRGSPRFLQHALCVTNVRIALKGTGMCDWRFEPQLRASFRWGGREIEVRPDGLAIFADRLTAVEVDLGHVSPVKFQAKLRSFEDFIASGACARAWQASAFSLLVVTTGRLRASHFSRLISKDHGLELECVSHEEFGCAFPGGWS